MRFGFPEPTYLVMDSITEPVTSGSELEEGEIEDLDNNDIEIISERIVRGPAVIFKRVSVAVGSPVRKGNDQEDGIVDVKSKKRKPSCEIMPELPQRFQESMLPERLHKKLRPGSHSDQLSDKNYQLRNLYKNNAPVRRYVDSKKKQRNSPKNLNQNNGYKAPKSLKLTGAEKSAAQDKKPPLKTGLLEASIESVHNDQEDDTDEEMELRLAALKSVVVKSSRTEEPSDKTSSLQLVPEEFKKAESEDDDEELLRAQLLIEVAKKQTKEMELQVRMETVTSSSNATAPKDASRQSITSTTATASTALMAKRKFNHHVQIPKTDRLVINLRDDSSDSSDEDDAVEDSISALIRSARQSADLKTSAVRSAVSALPLHEQEEYLRLKGEIERRANKAALATAQRSQERLPTEAVAAAMSAIVVQKTSEVSVLTAKASVSSDTVDEISSVAEPPKATQPTEVPSIPVNQPESKEPKEVEIVQVDSPELIIEGELKALEVPLADETGKSSEVVITTSALPTNVASQASASLSLLSKPSLLVKAGSSTSDKPKASVENLHAKKAAFLKQRLLQKKNATKDALKSQLELVDKNRALFERSSQEVVRLKAMLLTAEEAERQFRLQLNNSQSQLQQLNKNMIFIEKELNALHNGVAQPRAKRLNQKLRAKAVHTAMSVMNSSLHHTLQLRVKPVIVTKALTKKPIISANREKAASPNKAINRPDADLSDSIKSVHKQDCVNRAGAYEEWLYGTLGDAFYHTAEETYPSWSTNEHFSRKIAEHTVNPWKIVCNSSLGAKGCRDRSCSFQHFPEDTSVLSIETAEPPVDPNV